MAGIRGLAEGGEEFAGAGDGLTVKFENYIAGLESRAGCGGAGFDLGHHCAVQAGGDAQALAELGVEVGELCAVERGVSGGRVLGICALAVQGADLEFEVDGFSIAPDAGGDFAAGAGFGDHEAEFGAALDFVAIELQDDIARFQAGAFAGGTVAHAADEGPVRFLQSKCRGEFLCDGLDHDAEVATFDAAVRDERGHDMFGEVDRDGKSDALVAAGAAEDGLVDADEPAAGVDERAAGIAGVDGGVGLDEILVVHDAHAAAALGTDDAHGDGLPDAEGVADGKGHIAHFDLVAVGEGDRGGVAFFDFDDGDVGLRVCADEAGLVGGFIAVERNEDLVGAGDDMVVRKDVAIARDDDAGAEGLLTAFLRDLLEWNSEKWIEGVLEEDGSAGACGFIGVDVDDRRGDFSDHGGEGRRPAFAGRKG